MQPVIIVFTPKNVYNLAADYTYVDFSAHVDANYQDATQTFDQFDTTNDASFIMNARLNYSLGDHYRVSVWARNLLDEAHVYRRDPSNATTLGYYGNFNAPRVVGVSINGKW